MMQRLLFTLSLVGMAAAAKASTAGCLNKYEYEAHPFDAGYGDVCRHPETSRKWSCPTHCVETDNRERPFCYMKNSEDVCRPSQETACLSEMGTYYPVNWSLHGDICRQFDKKSFQCPSHCVKGAAYLPYCTHQISGRPCRLIDASSLIPASCPEGAVKYEAHADPLFGDVCKTDADHAECPEHCHKAQGKCMAGPDTTDPCRATAASACPEGFTYLASRWESRGDLCRFSKDGATRTVCPVHCERVEGQSDCYYQGSKTVCRLFEATLCPKGTYVSYEGQSDFGDLCQRLEGQWACPKGCTRVDTNDKETPYNCRNADGGVCRAQQQEN